MVSMNFSDGSKHTLCNKYFVLQIILEQFTDLQRLMSCVMRAAHCG